MQVRGGKVCRSLLRHLRDSHFVKAMTATISTGALLLVLLQGVAAAEVVPPVRPNPPFCSWTATLNCYGRLVPDVYVHDDEHGKGHIDIEYYAQECAKLTLPSECHDQLTLCPEEIKANMSFFEDGYNRTRDLICDRNALEDIGKLHTCFDFGLMEQCVEKYLPGASDLDEKDCRLGKVHFSCIDETFHESCPPDHEAFKTTLKSLNKAILMLHGCERSSQGSLAPHSFIVGLVATICLLRLKWT